VEVSSVFGQNYSLPKFYLPTDAQLICLKNNFRIYINP